MSECIFCSIIKGDIPSTKVYEDEKVLAFRDIAPQAPVHIVLIPKVHSRSLLEAQPEVMSDIVKAVKIIAKQEGIDEKGFRLVNNCGKEGGQTVDHLHFHLLGGRNLQWPPG
ncbi:MAG: histidine triad nucleotide-binding protein [Peptostreptococcaceae bacterium]|nr:histidine triad nucleotide-binding protein [Peptostreptococcaceae bacterium]